MKKSSVAAAALAAALAVLSSSCESLSSLLASTPQPSLSMNGVGIKGLDLEGITFNCDYSITNPYSVAFTVNSVTSNVMYDNSRLAAISTDNGVTVAANGTQRNSVAFKVPYESILKLAQGLSGKSSLPFSLDGAVSLDVSNIPVLSATGSTFSIPFSKSFDVPVVKPSLSVSNVSVKMPTLDALKDAFTESGIGAARAATLAAAIISGNGSLAANALDGIDLDVDMLFDLNVRNEGSAPWKFSVNDCSLRTASGNLAAVAPASSGSGSISSASGTVPMKASLNTLQAGAFIVQLLNRRGSNPVLNLESGLSFPGTKYAGNLPLAYSYEIPLSSIARK